LYKLFSGHNKIWGGTATECTQVKDHGWIKCGKGQKQ